MAGVRVQKVVFLSPSVAFLCAFHVPVALVEALYSLCNKWESVWDGGIGDGSSLSFA